MAFFSSPYCPLPDFGATIRILTVAEGGRAAPPFNGIKWDFAYASDGWPPPELYVIWPRFLHASGETIDVSLPLAAGVPLRAEMYVAVDEMRSFTHRNRIAVGIEFFCHEGAKRVASGVVTDILMLHERR